MTKTIQLNVRNQWICIRHSILCLGFAAVVSAFNLFLNDIGQIHVISIVFAFVLIGFLFLLPALVLHSTYLIYGRELKITVDTLEKTFSLTKNGKTSHYRYADIVYSEKNLNIYYKNRIDRVGRKINPWHRYAYLKFRLNDGTLFFITSLMTDIQDCNFKFQETGYGLFPIVLKRDWKTIDYSNFKHD